MSLRISSLKPSQIANPQWDHDFNPFTITQSSRPTAANLDLLCFPPRRLNNAAENFIMDRSTAPTKRLRDALVYTITNLGLNAESLPDGFINVSLPDRATYFTTKYARLIKRILEITKAEVGYNPKTCDLSGAEFEQKDKKPARFTFSVSGINASRLPASSYHEVAHWHYAKLSLQPRWQGFSVFVQPTISRDIRFLLSSIDPGFVEYLDDSYCQDETLIVRNEANILLYRTLELANLDNSSIHKNEKNGLVLLGFRRSVETALRAMMFDLFDQHLNSILKKVIDEQYSCTQDKKEKQRSLRILNQGDDYHHATITYEPKNIAPRFYTIMTEEALARAATFRLFEAQSICQNQEEKFTRMNQRITLLSKIVEKLGVDTRKLSLAYNSVLKELNSSLNIRRPRLLNF
jgi:hypothetical protein